MQCKQAGAQVVVPKQCTRSGQAVAVVYKEWPSSSSSVQGVAKQ